jgi:hypothetical protein
MDRVATAEATAVIRDLYATLVSLVGNLADQGDHVDFHQNRRHA